MSLPLQEPSFSHTGNSAQPPSAAADSNGLFPTTSHTLIHKIKSADHKVREISMARFCALYYPSIYGFARLRGLTIDDAQDRTQDFFVEVVRDGLLDKFDASRGSKLSSWLMKCFKNMDLNHRSALATAKRGGGLQFTSFDTDLAEQSYEAVRTSQLSEASSADLLLARAFWRDALAKLRARYADGPTAALVNELLPHVLLSRWPEPPMPRQPELAEMHGTTTTRLKAFFNRTLKVQARRDFNEVATESNPGITDLEINELWDLLRAHA